jgi:hypothetical protein
MRQSKWDVFLAGPLWNVWWRALVLYFPLGFAVGWDARAATVGEKGLIQAIIVAGCVVASAVVTLASEDWAAYRELRARVNAEHEADQRLRDSASS